MNELQKTFGPKKKLSNIYTFIGDHGFTKNLVGEDISKDHCLIEVHGEIDSLQAMIDKLIAYSRYSDFMSSQKDHLSSIQTLLWQLGGELSQNKTGGLVKNPIEQEHVDFLEETIDSFELNLTSFQRFTHLIAIDVNEARVRTRKLERTLTKYLRDAKIRPVVYKYINRLSDYFFSLAVKIQEVENDL
jgi:cob(I)alamin adenosyltransferase